MPKGIRSDIWLAKIVANFKLDKNTIIRLSKILMENVLLPGVRREA